MPELKFTIAILVYLNEKGRRIDYRTRYRRLHTKWCCDEMRNALDIIQVLQWDESRAEVVIQNNAFRNHKARKYSINFCPWCTAIITTDKVETIKQKL